MLCQFCSKQIPDGFALCSDCGRQMVSNRTQEDQQAQSFQQPFLAHSQQLSMPHNPSMQQASLFPPYQPMISPSPVPQDDRPLMPNSGNPTRFPNMSTNATMTNSYSASPPNATTQQGPPQTPPPQFQQAQPWAPPPFEPGQPSQTPLPQFQQAQPWAPPFEPGQPPQTPLPQFQQAQPWAPPFEPGQPSLTPHSQSIPNEPLSNLNGIQRLLIQLFQPSLARNPWLGIAIGGVSAALLAAITFLILITALDAQIPAITSPTALASSPNNVIPTGNPTHDGLQALIAAHGVARHINGVYSSNAANIIFNIDISSPLRITLFIPALFLTFGGYLAACTDMNNRPFASLGRGAAISIPYMLLLLVLVTQVNGDLPASFFSSIMNSRNSGLSQGSYNFTLNMDTSSLVLLSLFWGTIFGLLGASLKLAGRHWRNYLHNYLYNNRHPRLTAIIAGGLFATLLGFSLTLLLSYIVTVTNAQFSQGSSCLPSNTNVTGDVTASPFMAVQILSFSFGTPISLAVHSSGIDMITKQLVQLTHLQEGQTSCSLFGGTTRFPSWTYLLLLVPLLSLWAGGRISAYFGRPQSIGAAAIQGALIAVPFATVMALLAALSITNFSVNITGTVILLGNIPDTRLAISVGIGIIDVVAWSLLSGALLGMLGGVYQANTANRKIDFAIASLGRNVLLMLEPSFKFIDFLSTRRPVFPPRGRTLNLLYSALLATVVLLALSIIVGILLMIFSAVVTYDLNHRVHDIMNTLLIGIPGLLLVAVLISTFFNDPQLAPQMQSNLGI